jgi:hypothetical protein
MKKMIKKFGKLITASFIIMGIGIIVFILSLPLYIYYNIDTDVLGLIIVSDGLMIYIIGLIRRKKRSRVKLALLVILASVLGIPNLPLIVSLIYYFVTGKPLGN